METKLEQIAAKARCKPKLRFTSLAHHITHDRVRRNLLRIPKLSAAGVDGQTVEAAQKQILATAQTLESEGKVMLRSDAKNLVA